MDYKDTLNLPRTDFAMKADLVTREPRRLEHWLTSKLYERVLAARAGAEKFILHDGPPFANGDVHIGNALNKILKDMVIRFHSLCGRQTPYVPGWDCHGLPIELKVREAGSRSNDPATVRKACEEYAWKFINLQREQFKRLGILGEWDNPYITLNKAYEADELRLFADIVEKGFVYRGKKPVYWSIPARTALAEFEVEHRQHISQSVYVKFPIVGQPNLSLVIWTTTPWTLPANLAVAYNSTFNYALVRVGEEAFIVSNMLLSAVAEKCKWNNYEIVRTVTGDELASLEYQHPFIQRTGKLFAGDSFVTNDVGTGFVHVAPGHGRDDYNLGRDKGLPIYSPVNDDGAFTYTDDLPVEQQMPPELIGKTILAKHGKTSEANDGVIQLLRARNALLHQEDYAHEYPYCARSKTPIIFRAMNQWFINIDHQGFREKTLAAINQVQWIPEWGKNRIEGAVKSRPDWCISRQRSWGVPLPAFYDADGSPILEPPIIRSVADLVAQHGSNVWFEKTAQELWTLVRPKDWKRAEATAKSADTLDVWIDSGSSSRAVLMRHSQLQAGKRWQADMYLEGSDQHRGWFQSSLLLSIAANGMPPYRSVLTHGFMVDADREKISKSKQGQGGYEKPQTSEAYVNKYGADIVRLWVSSQDFRNDVVVSDERLRTVSETYRLLRNTLRYQLSNLYDFDPRQHIVPDTALTGLDRWILAQFASLEERVLAAYSRYEFHSVYQQLSQFAAVELSAIYHDLIKDRLYTDAANSPRRRSSQTALFRIFRGLAQMLSPIIAFTSDEAWELLAGKETTSVHESIWKPSTFSRTKDEEATWSELFALREVALAELEKARQSKLIGKALDAKVTISGRAKPSPDLKELLNVSQLEVNASDADPTVHVAKADGVKCARCWHWEPDVGADPQHPTICARCAGAVKTA
ncbi:MAG TPA: isoleucine--tRNA ligase [Verrucomicrobiae bacterium]|nr:isoleucine--tRNA ligase [Verrucomicrobiae bacterium]